MDIYFFYFERKTEWLLVEDNEVIDKGKSVSGFPSYLYDFIIFLLNVGKAERLIGYDLKKQLRFLGIEMKEAGLSLDREKKIVHLDVSEFIPKPENCHELYEYYQAYKVKETLQDKILQEQSN